MVCTKSHSSQPLHHKEEERDEHVTEEYLPSKNERSKADMIFLMDMFLMKDMDERTRSVI